MTPKFRQGDEVLVNGDALYGVVIDPPMFSCGCYLVRLVYPLGDVRRMVCRSYAERCWRLKV